MILKPTERETRKISQDFSYPLARLVNVTNTAEGPVLPNRLQGGTERVYTVSQFKVARVEPTTEGTRCTLVWSEPTQREADQLSFYQIYITDAAQGLTQPLSTTLVRTSPAVVTLPPSQSTNITFYCQTILKNGQVSDLAQSPTATVRLVEALDSTDNLVSPVTIANTAALTDVFSRNYEGGTIGLGTNWHGTCIGSYSTANAIDTCTVTFYSGPNTATFTTPAGAVTDAPFFADWYGVFYNTTSPSSNNYRYFLKADVNGTMSYTVSTISVVRDAAFPFDFNIRAQWSNALAGNTLTVSFADLLLY